MFVLIDVLSIDPIQRLYFFNTLVLLSVLSKKRIAMGLNISRVEEDNVRFGRRVSVLSRI